MYRTSVAGVRRKSSHVLSWNVILEMMKNSWTRIVIGSVLDMIVIPEVSCKPAAYTTKWELCRFIRHYTVQPNLNLALRNRILTSFRQYLISWSCLRSGLPTNANTYLIVAFIALFAINLEHLKLNVLVISFIFNIIDTGKQMCIIRLGRKKEK